MARDRNATICAMDQRYLCDGVELCDLDIVLIMVQ